MNTPKKTLPYCIDGIVRDIEEEHRINQIFRRVFHTDEGREAMEYLRSITINRVHGPEYDPKHLPHVEGQRFLVHIMATRADHGTQSIPHLTEKD